ncbi:SRPBCC family protein [bacterium]|nr:SRPBCC family protein [bacterium]
MTEFVMKAPFEVSADELWGTVGNWHRVDAFLPMITSCETTGGEPGANRHIRIEGGHWVKEELMRYEPEIRSYTYAILESSFPFRDYVATMKILEDPEGGCEFEWSCRFRPDGASEDEVIGIMEHFYSTGMAELGKLHSGTEATSGDAAQ